MNQEQALKALRIAPNGSLEMSKINPQLTQSQVFDILNEALLDSNIYDKWGNLSELIEKRVYQVCCDKMRPSRDDITSIKEYIE